jgi:tRNA A37 methylthiotransferase MiaB
VPTSPSKKTKRNQKMFQSLLRSLTSSAPRPRIPVDGKTLGDFLPSPSFPPVPDATQLVYVETYGCQMNLSDTSLVYSVLAKAGFAQTEVMEDADLVLINTCSVREKAEERVWGRLGDFKSLKRLRAREGARPPVVGVLGCMAERLKDKLLAEDKVVDIVVGPDAYRDLPRLVQSVQESPGSQAINVELSQVETYADIVPTRPISKVDNLQALISISRGCNHLCTYCIVPFTRGKERSRPVQSIINEAKTLALGGCKEITLLGQNVNNYAYLPPSDEGVGGGGDGAEGAAAEEEEDSGSGSVAAAFPGLTPGFKSTVKPNTQGVSFTELLGRVSRAVPEVRIRFTSPHPKNFPEETLAMIAQRPNICKSIHIPLQSGSSTVLERMWRGYSKEAYLALVDRVRAIVPGAAISTDIISGFCGETEEEHRETLDVIERVGGYDQAFMYAYSQRERTRAHRTLPDDVPQEVKLRRLQEVINLQNQLQNKRYAAEVGKEHVILVEGLSRKRTHLTGLTDTNKRVVLLREKVTADSDPIRRGDFVKVKVVDYNLKSLTAEPLAKVNLRGEVVG